MVEGEPVLLRAVKKRDGDKEETGQQDKYGMMRMMMMLRRNSGDEVDVYVIVSMSDFTFLLL